MSFRGGKAPHLNMYSSRRKAAKPRVLGEYRYELFGFFPAKNQAGKKYKHYYKEITGPEFEGKGPKRPSLHGLQASGGKPKA